MTLEETLDFINNPELELKDEIWKSHPIYTNLEGSNLGRIRREYKDNVYIKKQRTKKSEINRHDLLFTHRFNNKDIVLNSARFILECFSGLGNMSGYQCDHINSTPYDNNIKNLRWVENGKENMSNENTKEKLKLTHKGTSRKKVLLKYDDIKKESELKNEKWKKHPFYDNIEVSNLGRVIERVDDLYFEKVLIKKPNGYLFVTIGKNEDRKNIRVHILVAQTWIPNPKNKPIVDHINTDKTDNRVENLRWVDQKENLNNNTTKAKTAKEVYQIDDKGHIVDKFESASSVVKKGFTKFRVIDACNSGKKYRGFTWIYKDNYKKESYILSFDEMFD